MPAAQWVRADLRQRANLSIFIVHGSAPHFCICRVLANLSDPSKPLVMDGFAPGCNCLVVMQETMKVTAERDWDSSVMHSAGD